MQPLRPRRKRSSDAVLSSLFFLTASLILLPKVRSRNDRCEQRVFPRWRSSRLWLTLALGLQCPPPPMQSSRSSWESTWTDGDPASAHEPQAAKPSGSFLVAGPRAPRLRGRQRSLPAEVVQSRHYSLVGSAPTIVLRAAEKASQLAEEEKKRRISLASFASSASGEATGVRPEEPEDVRTAAPRSLSPEERARQAERRQRVAEELRDTEKSFVRQLEAVDAVSLRHSCKLFADRLLITFPTLSCTTGLSSKRLLLRDLHYLGRSRSRPSSPSARFAKSSPTLPTYSALLEPWSRYWMQQSSLLLWAESRPDRPDRRRPRPGD